jgi:ferritin-like metal-binding protein YciE
MTSIVQGHQTRSYGGVVMNQEQLTELLVDEIKDIYHAEKQLIKALPKMAKAADSESLKEAITGHLAETEGQVDRLEKIFSHLKMQPKGKPCKGMEGLLKEGAEAMEEHEPGGIRDLAIIGAARRVEHYEMAAYCTAKSLAGQVGHDQILMLLEQNEGEEAAAEEKLKSIRTEIYGSDEAEEEEEYAAAAVAGRGTSNAKRRSS